MAKIELKRSIKSKQLKNGLLYIQFNGTVATPLAAGPDEFSVLEIIKVGAGEYTVVLTEAYEQDLHVVGVLGSTQSDWTVVAVAEDRVTIKAAADDAAVMLTLASFDNRFKH